MWFCAHSDPATSSAIRPIRRFILNDFGLNLIIIVNIDQSGKQSKYHPQNREVGYSGDTYHHFPETTQNDGRPSKQQHPIKGVGILRFFTGWYSAVANTDLNSDNYAIKPIAPCSTA